MMIFTLMRVVRDFEYIIGILYFYALHSNNDSNTIWKKSSLKSLYGSYQEVKMIYYVILLLQIR